MITQRRALLVGMIGLVSMPAVVKADSLMRIVPELTIEQEIDRLIESVREDYRQMERLFFLRKEEFRPGGSGIHSYIPYLAGSDRKIKRIFELRRLKGV